MSTKRKELTVFQPTWSHLVSILGTRRDPIYLEPFDVQNKNFCRSDLIYLEPSGEQTRN
jgi:hypothetical protein